MSVSARTHGPARTPPHASAAGLVPITVSVLACPPAICPHVEFALSAQVHAPVSLEWSQQTALPGMLCATADGRVPIGTAGNVAARLRCLDPIWFDVIEGPMPQGERYSYVPELGMYRADLNANGDVMVSEMRLKDLIARVGSGPSLVEGISRLMGESWDGKLEPLRIAGEGGSVSVLRRTG